MKAFCFPRRLYGIIPTILLLTATVAVGQSTGTSEDVPPVNPALRRLERARALAAAHQLPAAASELENVRASVNDVALRNVTTLMLLGIYLEEGAYGRAQTLLDEAYNLRGAQKDESIRTYFAAAGQTLNGIRSHLARYRSFGINTNDSDLPVEANADLERVRTLLERVIAQAKHITTEAGRSYDALALLEDVLGIRLSLARDNADRDKWRAEYTSARERMATSRVQIAAIGRSPALEALSSKIPNPFVAPKPETQTPAENTDKSEENSTATPAPTASPAVGDVSASSTETAKSDGAEPKLISTGSLSGRESKRVTPTYPPAAKSNSIAGTVRVFVIVDEKGKVWVTNSEGPLALRKAAEDAARGWSFPPTLISSRAVRVAGYIDFEFKL